MRLTKIKLAGFKSFVDPTQITFPSNLTGVVGPNGCGKSNVIDAVRWVMGELSAKHLRGDNMADVVFNGSAARKPVGMASVELVFDNSDGKIGGAYASYGEISLKRQVARDDTSAYFINGVRCRRKDITNLFLGTGLGSRSYAIIEQGTISRVIEAKSEDMRAFVEEAAGVSRYKERRKETEARIAETRENLERLQDVRDEVEKQIRHLQRQAATARRYQALKEQERRLAAELLALRLRDLDSGGKVHDAAVRGRELAMQEALAAQRAAEAAIEKQRAVQAAHGERLSAVQGRYYQVGADISRLEQSIEHTRELRERQRADLAQAQATLGELAAHIARDQGELAAVRAEIAQLGCEERLEGARGAREAARGELTSLEALQAAALSDHAGQAAEWLRGAGLAARPRLAADLEVEPGWERAVETALGDYLEAVCVERLEELSGALAGLAAGRLTLVESGERACGAEAKTLAAHVKGPPAVIARLAAVSTAESLGKAFAARGALVDGRSFITAAGEWVGRDWLRVSRGPDPRAGTLEREHRLRSLRGASAEADQRVAEAEAELAAARERQAQAETERERTQTALQAAQQRHAELLGRLKATQARAEEVSERGERLQQSAADIARESAVAEEALSRAAAELARAQALAAELATRERTLSEEREERRAALGSARARSQEAQARARDLHVSVESRRSSESSMAVGLRRMSEQREQLERRRAELEQELATGDEPIGALQARLDEALALRLTVEAELAVARSALEEADAALKALDERRLTAEQRVSAAREELDAARLAAQETHVRRAALAEQFAETGCDLGEVLAGLEPTADVAAWEQSLAEARAEVEKLGQVNLAAIDELKEQTQRQEYLDSQYADLTSALSTLEEAMRRIDKETRARFEDTFERINTGLRDKFPRLFGGGHAYLELVGEDKHTAGVAVMARPPGKKNSTIHLLSGGEKALTAVALVFAIFDLNPAPFCLLDEVDAPLDEHNVGRFCDIVRDMSSRVQFVLITHNKATMELVSQLIGVTMNEPGVSRLVTVDVDEAVRLAAV